MNAPMDTQIRFDEATHTYWQGVERIPSVTQILAPLVDFSGIKMSVLERASARGHAVHYGTELYDQNDLDWASLDPELRPYIEAWAEFRLKTGFVPDLIEQRVFHPGLRYAGTLDRTGLLDGEPSVLDVKSSVTLYPTVGLQTVAYAEALHAGNPTMPRHTGRYAVQVKKDGKYVLKHYTDKTDWPTFIALKTMMRWADHNQTRINYEPNT